MSDVDIPKPELYEHNPCPQCGSNFLIIVEDIAYSGVSLGCYVKCEKCKFMSERYYTRKELYSIWKLY